MKSKVAIFSDLHLGLYGNSTDWHDIALKWADWIVEDMKKKKIKDVFFLGDFFHNRSEISVQTVHVASELITKFEDFNMIMVVGNHDAYYKNRSDVHSLGLLKGHKNLNIIDDNLIIEEFGKKMAFVPWNNDLPIGKFDYIFGHFEIQSFRMNNFKVCDHGLSPMDFLASQTDRVFSGHFHTRSIKKYNEGSIQYVGNTFHHDFNDVGDDRGYHILDIETGGIEFINNSVSPRFKRIKMSEFGDIDEKSVGGDVIKLVIDVKSTDEEIAIVENKIKSWKPFWLNTEYNVVSSDRDGVEHVESVEILEMFDEFYDQLKLDVEVEKRVRKINERLYEKSNV